MSVTKCDTLQDVVNFILNRHTSINRKGKGVNCWKILRRPNGDRIPFEEMHGVRFRNFSVYDHNTLIIEQQSHGSVFNQGYPPPSVPEQAKVYDVAAVISSCSSSAAAKQHKKHVFSAKTYLPELSLINIYDHSAEFRTTSGIELFYSENTYETSILLMSSWVNDISDILRAQWFCDEIDELLMSCGTDPKMERTVSLPRGIDFGMDL